MTAERLPHPDDELLDELLDERLPTAERRAVEAHLADCERCRRLYETLVATRELLRATSAAEAPPPQLAGAVREALAAAPGARRPAPWGRWLAAAAALTLVLATALWLRAGAGADPIADLVALHRTGEPDLVSSDIAALEAALVARLPFRPRVLDLAMMDLHLVGGGVADVVGTRGAWMIYEGPDGRLVCVMVPGDAAALPATDDVRPHAAFVFRVYRRGSLTVVTWQEGELVCVLVGGGDPEAVVALAMGKAMLPAAAG
jgi:anti-sigma factor RsiW